MSRILEHHLSEELSAIEQEVDEYERAWMKIDGKIEGFLEALAQRKGSDFRALVARVATVAKQRHLPPNRLSHLLEVTFAAATSAP